MPEKTRSPRSRAICGVPDCGRHLYARGYCQTHHRQVRTGGEVKAIRPYHRRESDTVKLAGFRLSPPCAELIEVEARRRSIAVSAMVTEILEEWFRGRRGG